MLLLSWLKLLQLRLTTLILVIIARQLLLNDFLELITDPDHIVDGLPLNRFLLGLSLHLFLANSADGLLLRLLIVTSRLGIHAETIIVMIRSGALVWRQLYHFARPPRSGKTAEEDEVLFPEEREPSSVFNESLRRKYDPKYNNKQ